MNAPHKLPDGTHSDDVPTGHPWPMPFRRRRGRRLSHGPATRSPLPSGRHAGL